MLSIFKSKSILSETKFSERFYDGLKKEIEGLELVSINSLEVTTKVGGSEEYRHFLDNAYSEYRNDPKDLDNILGKYMHGAIELYLPEEPVQLGRIVPVIKDERFLIETAKFNSEFEDDYVYAKYNSELFIFYAEDKQHTISYLNKANFDALGISMEALHEHSIENLNAILPDMERHGEERYFMLTAGGNLEASLILLDIWNKENFPVDGEILIGIPARDVVLITGTNDAENVERLVETVAEINETGDHIVSDKIFRFYNGKFEKWD